MKAQIIDRAFILAAGMGTRLRPHTDHCPKPMVPVAGTPIIDRVLNDLSAAGVTEVGVNLHYRATQLEAHLAARKKPRLRFFHEESLLDTGGGLKAALPMFGDESFFAVAGDSFWHDDGPDPALARMAAAWNADEMDLLLLLQPLSRMTLTGGRGDYDILPDGRAVRSKDQSGAYMWTSVRICAPALFDDTPDGPFSFLALMDRAERAGRLRAIVHGGEWYHISTPDDLAHVDEALRATA